MIIQDYPSYLNFPGFYFNATLNADELKYRLPLGTRSYNISVFAFLCSTSFLISKGERFKISSGLASSVFGISTTCFLESKYMYKIIYCRYISLCILYYVLCIYIYRILILYQNRIIVMNAMHVSEFLTQIDTDYIYTEYLYYNKIYKEMLF